MYYGELQEAIRHYTNLYGYPPTIIYCNHDEYQDTKLQRETKMRWAKNNFALSNPAHNLSD
jgi:hypothetical protein